MRLINWFLGVLMVLVVGAVVVAAYSLESHNDGKVEVYGVVQQRGEPFATLQISYAMDAGATQFATLTSTKAKFTTPKTRLVPGRNVTVFIRYEPSTGAAFENERRCQIFVDGKPVVTSDWLNRNSVDVCRWAI